jgi:hypothetical protein
MKSIKPKPMQNQSQKPKQESVELSAVKIEQLNKQPAVETSMKLSKDKRWFIYRTTITDIKPVSYLDAVLDNG